MRRSLSIAGGLLAAATLAALVHGVRFPPLRLEPSPRPVAVRGDGLAVTASGAYLRGGSTAGGLEFRAYAPEPALRVEVDHAARVSIELANVHPEARLVADGPVRETVDGLQRRLEVEATPEAPTRVSFAFPARDPIRFAAIGDAGGRGELAYCLRRAAALGADFVLHLGDFDYAPGAFETAEQQLRAAPVPVFAAVGNHDVDGPLTRFADDFTRRIGPRNARFTLAGVTFVDLDTAADTLLPMRGVRGELLRALAAERAAGPRGPLLVFTHRPLADPRTLADDEAEPHALNREWESGWLRRTLLAIGAQALLAGHIHESHHIDDGGLDTWISGDGLGQQDFTPGGRARILIGEFSPGSPVRLHWEPLEMPREIWFERLRSMGLSLPPDLPPTPGPPSDAGDPP